MVILDAGKTLDALSAKRLADQTAFFHNLDFLQVRLEGPACRFHRKATIASESRLLTAVLTLCHQPNTFLRKIYTSIERRQSYHNLLRLNVFSEYGGHPE